MIRINSTFVGGFYPAIHGLRNSYQSHDNIDSRFFLNETITTNPGTIDICQYDGVVLGPNDGELIEKLVKAGEPHCKFRRMIQVWVDIVAPLYWWKQFDTYKVGTVANSTSTMHNLSDRPLTVGDFSYPKASEKSMAKVVDICNEHLVHYYSCKRAGDEEAAKAHWNTLISLLPESYNQGRTVMLNYSVLASIYEQRKGHKLQEWRDFIEWSKTLPHSWIFTGVFYDDQGRKTTEF